MSQKDNFSSGFLLGAIVGGAVGGVLGALLASRQLNEVTTPEEPLLNSNQAEPKLGKSKKKVLKSANGQSNIEAARRSLEDKIAQLNEAIDDVRHQLGGMQRGASGEEGDRSISREP